MAVARCTGDEPDKLQGREIAAVPATEFKVAGSPAGRVADESGDGRVSSLEWNCQHVQGYNLPKTEPKLSQSISNISGSGVPVPGDDIARSHYPSTLRKCVTFDGLGDTPFDDRAVLLAGTRMPLTTVC